MNPCVLNGHAGNDSMLSAYYKYIKYF
uniref:Uncharacterized protein n=1 Tax=Anguilla anguilla TaxID=7936 RepID=A0A0E9R3M0_ANGAN